jgi:Fe-S-cluster containining protein
MVDMEAEGLAEGVQIREEVIDPSISCLSCVGACCQKGTAMELTLGEAVYFLKNGNKLKTLHQPVKESGSVTLSLVAGHTIIDGQLCAIVRSEDVYLTAGHGLYELLNRCAFLEDTPIGPKCMSYEERPGVCRDFPEGGYGCQTARETVFGGGEAPPNWQPIDLSAKPPR